MAWAPAACKCCLVRGHQHWHFCARSFRQWAKLSGCSRFARGLVLDAQGNPSAAESACTNGERIYYYRELEQETEIPFYETILYQDEHILVADKPHFLPVIPSGKYVQQTLLVRLKKTTGIAALSPVHRIDKDTAGLVLFSVNPATRDAYQSMFRSRAVKKTYHAVAPLSENLLSASHQWPFRYCSRLVEDEQFFRTCEVAGEANSETHIELIKKSGELGSVSVATSHRPKTPVARASGQPGHPDKK